MAVNYELEYEANQFRVKNGIGSCDPLKIESLLLKLGVLAVFKPLSEKFSGMAIKSGIFKAMLVNSEHRISKQNFTVAHELYHLFIQQDFTSEISITGKFDPKNPTEYKADCFASYLLMPRDGVISLIPEEEKVKNKITLPTIIKIEQYFSCSRRAVLFRLKEIGLIDYGKYESTLMGVRHSAILLGYDDDLYKKGNEDLVISNYGPRAKNLYDNDCISESHFISLMADIGVDVLSTEGDNEQE